MQRALRSVLSMAVASTLALPMAAAGSTAAASSAKTLKVGSVTLSPCSGSLPGWCGTVSVPLDWQAPASAGDPNITVGFEWLPATGKATGTIVTIEGGPGYSSTGSESQYAAMVGPLAADRNVLVFDLRGTGLSTPINCSSLQHFTGIASGTAFATLVGNCGAQLNTTWKNAAGNYVQASDLFDTANAARDLHYALGKLDLTGVDLYGDSYGTYFDQTFASRYPGDLRSVTMDAAYPVLGIDAWSVDILTSAENAFNVSCQRSPACAAVHQTGNAWDDISALVTSLRANPVTGTTVGLGDKPVTQTVDNRVLVDLVNNAGFDPAVYSQLDAAALAYVDHGDSAPLLRLAAWSVGYDDTNPTAASAYSDGLYFATICTDYPQLFTMSASPATRLQQFQAAVAAEPAGTFAPFTTAEWVQSNAYNGAYDACLDWPAPTVSDPPVIASPPLVPSTLPVLVVSGDLDSTTAPDGNVGVVADLGSSARYIEIPNDTHVTAMPSSTWPGTAACGESLYLQFVTDPADLGSLDTTCTKQTTPIAVLGSFPQTLGQVATPSPAGDDQAGQDALRAASVGASTVADAIARYDFLNGTKDLGLRGGSWKSSGNNTLTFTFTADQWVADATTAGTASWNQTTGAVSAKLTVTYDNGTEATVDAKWNTLQTLAPAQLTGNVDGAVLDATVPVP